MRNYVHEINTLNTTDRILLLKERMLDEPRFLSLDQAKLITKSYKQNENDPRPLQRAKSLAMALENIEIKIDPDELIVGNRTPLVRGGVVSPEAGISWVDREIETLHCRPQDRFQVRKEDIGEFRNEILPYWKGKSLEDFVRQRLGDEISGMGKVVKINQTDHAQGHICPNTKKWLEMGPTKLLELAEEKRKSASADKKVFYESTVISLKGALAFIKRYASLADTLKEAEKDENRRHNLAEISRICTKLTVEPAGSFHEAVQSLWFLYVILQMESNASSFSPGRMDQYLYPYFKVDTDKNGLTLVGALEIIESLWLKFNQIVYLRNSNSAKYFAGFPIGFNVACGGMTADGKDASNELSFLFLKAQEHLLLPQPNLSVRLFSHSDKDFVFQSSRIIGKGGGMPQVFNDESVIPTLENQGIEAADAKNYAIVGCVELTTHGNNLGWSDAAMFNMMKALELTLNNGKCLQTGTQMGLQTGYLTDYQSFDMLEKAFQKQIDYFIDRMIITCDAVDKMHAEFLPSPFLSVVIDDCLKKGVDVTAGGAYYNLSGIQVIQVANIADSLAVIKKLVYEDKSLKAATLLEALQKDYAGFEDIRQTVINKVAKYGNNVAWVDELGNKWIAYFANKLKNYTNARGGKYHTGLYTVSAHIPMGHNVGASTDGRRSREPLADGGMSAMYGRDKNGPTALLKSVSRVDSMNGSNGTLLNMKFLPDLFETKEGIEKFAAMLMTFVDLKITHVQFNVVRKEDLLKAKENPEAYRGLTIRVAGYTAYFTELASDLQDEIIARTSYTIA